MGVGRGRGALGRLTRAARWGSAVPPIAQGTPVAEPGSGSLQAAIDAAITAEAAGVTFVGAARQQGAAGTLDLGPAVVRLLRATQCQDEAHYHFLESIGAVPAATAFSFPPAGLLERVGFLQALVELEAITVAAYMALARRAAEVGDLGLVEVAYQMGAVDAQHEALMRYFLGAVPASERAFARWRFVDPAEAGEALVAAGFLDGAGEAVPFPGPVDRLCEGVVGLVPETTDDVINAPPAVISAPPAATPRPVATPVAAPADPPASAPVATPGADPAVNPLAPPAVAGSRAADRATEGTPTPD